MERIRKFMEANRIGFSSSCFYPEEAIDAIEKSVSLGFSTLEVFINTFSELEKPHLNEVKKLCRETGTRIVSLHPFTSGYEYMLFFSASKKRAYDSANFYRKYFSAAAELGADYVVFHGDRNKDPYFGMENYCEIYGNLARVAESEGVTLAHETVSTCRSGNPAFMRELREKMGKGNIKFTFDLKQVVRAGYDPMEMLDVLGDDLVHVHINDWKDGSCKLPYAGSLDLDEVIGRIEREGYRGSYIIEVYHHNFESTDEIVRSAEILRSKKF